MAISNEQLILKRGEKKIIELKHYFSYIKVSKMIVSGIDKSKEILLNDMVLRMTYINGNTKDVKEIYLASLIKGELPILEDVFYLPYRNPSAFGTDKTPEKLWNEIELEFIYSDFDSEIKYEDYKNRKDTSIKLYMFFERTPGIKIN